MSRELPDVAQLKRALDLRDWRWLSNVLPELRTQDLALAFRDLEPYSWVYVFKLLNWKRAGRVFAQLQQAEQWTLVRQLTPGERRELLKALALDDLVVFAGRMELEGKLDLVLDALPTSRRLHVERLLRYPPGSVARLMTTEIIRIQADSKVAAAMAQVQALAARAETVEWLAVLDHRGGLLGLLRLTDLMLARPQRIVVELPLIGDVSVLPTADREEALKRLQHYDLNLLPVLGEDRELLGIVTVDDLMDVAREETTEDFQRLGSVGSFDLGLREARPSLLYRKRVGWLLLLVLANLFGGYFISRYEVAIEAVVALVFFLPLIVDSAGNAGIQSAILTVRALGTGDVRRRDWFRLLIKESLVALALGLTLAVAVSVLGIWRGGVELAAVVAISMFAVVVMASLIGMLLPLLLERSGLDPATASAPLVTTIADLSGIVIYFSMASLILQID